VAVVVAAAADHRPQRFLFAELLAVTKTVAAARNVRRRNGAATVITGAAGIAT
jgi:hypothetical protein